jgi:hypothetical protein
MEETICSHQAIFVICVQILYNKDTIIWWLAKIWQKYSAIVTQRHITMGLLKPLILNSIKEVCNSSFLNIKLKDTFFNIWPNKKYNMKSWTYIYLC